MKLVKILIIISIFFLPSSLLADDEYFPGKIFSERPGIQKFVSDWYCQHLKALGEPSVYQKRTKENKTIIRFTWLRTFDHPIVFRLETNNDGSGTLYTKVTNGAGGYQPGVIIKDVTKTIQKQTVSTFITSVENNEFWGLPSRIETSGLDGSHWIIEYVSNGKYHLVDRWSPKSGAIREIGLNLLELSGLKVDEIY